jgi:hypothetical protein
MTTTTITTHATTTITTHAITTNRAQALGWLAHGAELAAALIGERATHHDVIWQLIVEAVEAIDKTPDRERRWLTSGKRSSWNMTGMTRAELVALERIRLQSGMKPFDGAANYRPRGEDLERALDVMSWLAWCNSARSGDRLRKAAVALARDGDVEIVRAIYCPERKSRDSQIAHDVRTRVVGYIKTGLRDDLGIVPGEGVSFR